MVALWQTFHSESKEGIEIRESDVIIIQGGNRIIIPREIYEPAKTLAKNQAVYSSMTQNFAVLSSDPSIDSFGVMQKVDSDDYLVKIQRSDFPLFCLPVPVQDESRRKTDYDDVELRLLKVVLEKGGRKWEFVWNGIRISAPILDESFWEQLRERKIQIAQGDSIIAKLRVHQVLDPYSQVYLNERYEVTEVKKYNHVAKTGDLFK